MPTQKPHVQVKPCSPNPCGPNALCQERNNAASCICISGYFGNPYEGCRPECLINSDCSPNLACLNNKCQDPCLGFCGINSECQVVNHVPKCNCIVGYAGNPYDRCILKEGKIYVCLINELLIVPILLIRSKYNLLICNNNITKF